MMAFAKRNWKELLRDPMNLAFALGFPLAVLGLLSLLQANIPVTVFPMEALAPGIAMFGLAFIALFSGMLLAKDRSESFLTRLFSSPMTSAQFLAGYMLPLVPLAMVQCVVCFGAAVLLGLPLGMHLFWLLLIMLPCAALYIGLGLLAGSLLTDKQVGGLCGALLTNLTAWLSGTWFDLRLVGEGFRRVAYLLPFAHVVDAGKAAIRHDYAQVLPHLWWVIGYAALAIALAVWVFARKMKNAMR